MADEEKKKESLWDEDLAGDSALQSFMKENFYKRITGGAEIEILEIAKDHEEESEPIVEPPEVKGGATIKTTRLHNNMDCQMRGIDLVVSYPNDEHKETMNVEVKSALHNLNNRLPTFAMELLYEKENEIKIGWFIDERKTDTTDYLFLWPRSKKLFPKEELHKLTEEDIYYVETIRVKKGELKTHVRKHMGLESKDLLQYAKWILNNDETLQNDKSIQIIELTTGKNTEDETKEQIIKLKFRKKTPQSGRNENANFYHSQAKRLSEQPVNLLITKKDLRKYAKTSYLVTQKYVCKYLKNLIAIKKKICEKCEEKGFKSNCENCYYLHEANKSELKGMVKGYLYSIPDNSKFVVQIDSVWQIIREF